MKRLALATLALLVAFPAAARDFSPGEQAEVIRAAAALVEQRYVDADKAVQIADAMRRLADERRRPMEGQAFADEVTDRFRAVSGDGHLGLSYSEQPIPEDGGETQFSAAEMDKWYGPQVNHGVEKIERLAGNVMLLDLRVFPPPAMGADVIAAAMTVVAQGEALIIDLRANGGGDDTADLLTGYLVEGGSPLTGSYDRPSDTRRYASSPEWVPGRRFGDSKPLYILTSRRTFSAAEGFAYNLQALGRATVVGEVTGGGAHPFEYRRVHAHFAVDLPEGTSINPITGTNWEGVGVQPDVAVPAAQALDKALELARAAIAAR
jgi:C-terminal processing protease CtpA/Prc